MEEDGSGLLEVAMALRRDHAHLRNLERLQLDLDRGDTAPEGSSSQTVPSPAGVSFAKRLTRAIRSLDKPMRAMPVRSFASRNLA